jgi:hypothetical protein
MNAPPEDAPEQKSPGCEWSARRAAESPFLCALLLLFTFSLAVGVNVYYGPGHAALAVIVLTVALVPFYAKYRYVLSPDSVQVHGPFYYTENRWSEFDGWRLGDDELRLIYKRKIWSSVLVLYAPDSIESVVQYVQRYLPADRLEDRRL